MAFLGLVIIAVLIGIYIWLGKAERRENLSEKLKNVADTGDEALLLLLSGAQSDEEKEELLRFAESGKYQAAKQNVQADDKVTPVQSPLSTEEFLAEQQPLEQVQNDEDWQSPSQAGSANKFDLETLPIFDEPEPDSSLGVQAAVDELMRQSENQQQAKPGHAEMSNDQPDFTDLNEDAFLTAPYKEEQEDETIIV